MGIFGNIFGKKYKKEADIIGRALHEQIYDAMKSDEKLAGKNLKSAFFVGYMYSFVSAGFIVQGVSGDQLDKYLKYICDGVIPGRLWEIFNAQLKYMESVKELLQLEENPEMVEGGAAGLWDGSNLITVDNRAPRTNLKSYLLGKKLDYLEPNT